MTPERSLGQRRHLPLARGSANEFFVDFPLFQIGSKNRVPGRRRRRGGARIDEQSPPNFTAMAAICFLLKSESLCPRGYRSFLTY
jgi:hypothetical protein